MELFSLSCEDNPNRQATSEVVMMMTNQQANASNNYAIANYGPVDTVHSVSFNTECFGVEPLDENQDGIIELLVF